MSEVGSAVGRINVPPIVAAGLGAAACFADQGVGGPLFADARDDQFFCAAVGLGDQVGVPFIFDGDFPEIREQQHAGSARQALHGSDEVLPRAHARARRPPSSAMYMISCLKMNRLGPLSRVRRTMETS